MGPIIELVWATVTTAAICGFFNVIWRFSTAAEQERQMMRARRRRALSPWDCGNWWGDSDFACFFSFSLFLFFFFFYRGIVIAISLPCYIYYSVHRLAPLRGDSDE